MEDLAHPRALNAHACHSDDIGAGNLVEVERLDVLVDDAHAVLGGRERGKQRQARDRHRRTLADQRQGMLQAPVRGLEPRVDEDDVGHCVPSNERSVRLQPDSGRSAF